MKLIVVVLLLSLIHACKAAEIGQAQLSPTALLVLELDSTETGKVYRFVRRISKFPDTLLWTREVPVSESRNSWCRLLTCSEDGQQAGILIEASLYEYWLVKPKGGANLAAITKIISLELYRTEADSGKAIQFQMPNIIIVPTRDGASERLSIVEDRGFGKLMHADGTNFDTAVTYPAPSGKARKEGPPSSQPPPNVKSAVREVSPAIENPIQPNFQSGLRGSGLIEKIAWCSIIAIAFGLLWLCIKRRAQ